MAKASINFKSLKSNSKSHNEREKIEDYVRADLIPENEKWKEFEIGEKIKSIRTFGKSKTKRAMRKDATPIREAVVNIEEHHTMDDLKKLAADLEQVKGIKCFQIFIHRDEGRWVDSDGVVVATKTPSIKPERAVQWKPNLHAHMLFDWQNKHQEYSYKTKDKKGDEMQKTVKVGSVHRLQPLDLVRIQDITSEALKMQRGERRNNGKAANKRLEAVQYKIQQDQLALDKLRQLAESEQKKNTAALREYQAAEREHEAAEREYKKFTSQNKARRATISELARQGIELDKTSVHGRADELSEAVELQQRWEDEETAAIRELEKQYRELRAEDIQSEAEDLQSAATHREAEAAIQQNERSWKAIAKFRQRIDEARKQPPAAS